MTIVEQLRKERDEYRKSYIEYQNLYVTILKLYAELKNEYDTAVKKEHSERKCLVVQFCGK